MTEQLHAADRPNIAPVQVVEAFLYAVMRDKDFDVMRGLIADDIVFENVGYPTLRGGPHIVEMFRNMSARAPFVNWDVEFHRIVNEGATVLTERTDWLIIGRFQAHFWVCGVFEVSAGRVSLWRDHFDLLDIIKGMVRGLVALAIPSLQRRRPPSIGGGQY
jgi:limonene-1,2-epoxide hydrolase